MSEHPGFPYKGHRVLPQVEQQDDGSYAACFEIRSKLSGTDEVRYERRTPTSVFPTEDEAIAYILDFSGDWIDQNQF
jgi:hypothetical protein